jgi:hypothetical protein
MKIDPKLIQALLTLPDEQLWATVRAVATTKNIQLSETPPPKETMAKLRGASRFCRTIAQRKNDGGWIGFGRDAGEDFRESGGARDPHKSSG